jgi:hypothetical protein
MLAALPVPSLRLYSTPALPRTREKEKKLPFKTPF